eukprot:3989521-Pleurochrysis_carterae.AAC.1
MPYEPFIGYSPPRAARAVARRPVTNKTSLTPAQPRLVLPTNTPAPPTPTRLYSRRVCTKTQ